VALPGVAMMVSIELRAAQDAPPLHRAIRLSSPRRWGTCAIAKISSLVHE
jgi:hypothetical protein